MGNHSNKNMSPARPTGGSGHTRRYWYLGIIVLLGIGAWFVRPHMVLSRSKSALLKVSTLGLGSHVTATATTANGTVVPIAVKAGNLWPEATLSPNTSVTVTVHDAGFLGWSATQTKTLVTPAAPQLVSDTVKVPLDRSLVLTYNGSVADVMMASSKKTEAVNDSRHVAIGPTLNRPNQRGVVEVAARARSWEKYGKIETVSYASVPYVTAALSQVSSSNSVPATAPLKVTFSTPMTEANVSEWNMSPSVPGSWHKINDETYEFQPSGIGFTPASNITVTIPGGSSGPRAKDGSILSSNTTLTYQVPAGLTETMQEWLAELDYLPVSFTPSSSASTANWQAAYSAPNGSFSWRYADVPESLEDLWSPTNWSVITQGAVYSFEHQHGLALTPTPGAQFWAALRQAVIAHQVDTTPYAYIYVSETLPERLWLYVGGKVILTTLANTGIPQTPTTIGTFPVQIRTPFQIMKGTNPDGTPYADPVHWINYFHGSEAVHGFLRASYGFPQSLGCVEVPIPEAQKIYPHLYIGALVSVHTTGSSPIQIVPAANAND